MYIVIDISDELYRQVKDPSVEGGYIATECYNAIYRGMPLPNGEIPKRCIEKDIETLNEIIDSGWLISDLEKCTAIDACEDAITALKQYPVLDKIRAEVKGKIVKRPWLDFKDRERDRNDAFLEVLDIIDKYSKEQRE